jgi:hypothetical protein
MAHLNGLVGVIGMNFYPTKPHPPISQWNQKMYLAPFGTQMKAMDSTAISFLDLEMWLDQSVRCNHTFIVFDVGHEVEGDWKFPGPSLVNTIC